MFLDDLFWYGYASFCVSGSLACAPHCTSLSLHFCSCALTPLTMYFLSPSPPLWTPDSTYQACRALLYFHWGRHFFSHKMLHDIRCFDALDALCDHIIFLIRRVFLCEKFGIQFHKFAVDNICQQGSGVFHYRPIDYIYILLSLTFHIISNVHMWQGQGLYIVLYICQQV